MKRFNLLRILPAGILAFMMASCENQEVEYPNFDYSTVYFAYQSPVRTIVLGEDIVDNTLDNAHKCAIYAAMGGVYSNSKSVDINFEVDNSLCDNLFYDKGFTSPVIPMPSEYYTLSSSNTISLNNSLQGGVEVQLTDAFFADSKSLANTYVIPLRMTGVTNADSILQGIPLSSNPPRGYAAMWDVQPKDYVLYCVKYINPWHANYLRRGVDVITYNGEAKDSVRHKPYVEKDEVIQLTSLSMDDVLLPMSFTSDSAKGINLNVKLKVSFGKDQKCTVSQIATAYQINDSVRIYNISASGNGEFVKKGEKNSWGNKDRDALYVKYNVGYEVEIKYPKAGRSDFIEMVTYNTTDTLVVRDRGVKLEEFAPQYKAN